MNGVQVTPRNGNSEISNRQNKPVLYARNGPAVLVNKVEVILDGNLYGDKTLGYLMPRERSIDIDDEFDLKIADFLLRDGR